MDEPSTADKLRDAAQLAFWDNGYSNVSVRQIANAAQVDVALISRYFGGKMGLFEATLHKSFDLDNLPEDRDGLVELFVDIFSYAPRDTSSPSALRMLLINAHDDAVGPLVRARFEDMFTRQVARVIGNLPQAALFVAALFGFMVAEKTLHLPGIGEPGSPLYANQLRHLLHAALAFDPDVPNG